MLAFYIVLCLLGAGKPFLFIQCLVASKTIVMIRSNAAWCSSRLLRQPIITRRDEITEAVPYCPVRFAVK